MDPLVLYTDAVDFPLDSALRARAASNGFRLRFMEGHEAAEMARQGTDCVGSFFCFGYADEALLSACPKWRILARIGTGYERLDVAAAKRRGIMVTNVPDFSTEEISNQVMLFILAFARQLPFLMEATREKRWPPVTDFPRTERLSEQTLGVLGFGNSGRAVAVKGRAFGMRVLTWSRTPRRAIADGLGVEESAFEDVLGCDYVSIHLPLTPETTHLIDHQSLRHFKSSAVLINTSRGGIVDTDGLAEALETGRLRGAGLDVVDPQPLPENHPIWSMPNVLLTMHTAALSRAAQRTAIETALDDVGRFLRGEKPVHPVPELA